MRQKATRHHYLTLVAGVAFFSASIYAVPPPAPPDKSPVLRADQIHQLQREKSDREAGVLTKQPSAEATKSSRTLPGRTPIAVRKDTGLKIAKVADAKSRRPVEAQADQVLVRFKPDRTNAERTLALTRHQTATIERTTSALEKLGYRRVRVPTGVAAADFIANLSKDASVERVEGNVILRSHAEKPADPTFGPNWGLQAIRAIQAWEITQGDPSVIVAVVDSGIAGNHPDLADALVLGYNFIADNAEAQDDFGHGTQVAGIIAGHSNTVSGTTGVASRSRLMPLKVLDANGEGTAADVAEAIIYAADSGVRIITLALGTYAESGILQAAVEYAAGKKCLVISAAGNNGTEEPVYPAAYAQTLAVGAVNQFRKPCFFSNRASYIDVVAPGEGILTTSKDGGHQELNGTSASAAHVAGLAALMLARTPLLTPDIFHAVVRASASDLQTAGWDKETGFGLVDCFAALNQTNASSIDVGIVDSMILPQQPRPGQTASIVLTIRNHGVQPFQSATLDLSREGHSVVTTNLPPLAAKQTREVIIPWVPLETDAETTVSLLARIEPLPGEMATTDNSRQVEVPVTNKEHRDLAVISAHAVGAPLNPGDTCTVEVTVANLGNVAATNVVLKSTGFQRSTTNVLSLSAGERRTVATEWTFPDDRPGPEDVHPVYSLVFAIEPVESEQIVNNTCVLKLGTRRESGQIVPFHATGDAYSDNKYVHQWIALAAYSNFISQVSGADIGSYLGTISGSFIAYDSDLLEGTFAEDKDYRDPLNQFMPYNRHFCAGADGSELDDGLMAYDSAYTQALA